MSCFFLNIEVGYSQYLSNRYQNSIFPNLIETNQVLFAANMPIANPGGGFYEFITGLPGNVDESDTSHINLFRDIFQPQGDTLSKRPVAIVCFGGGFIAGSKDSIDIRLIAQELCRQGYVTATIDYRLGMNLFDNELAKRAVYRGIQDGRAAVRFFKASVVIGNPYKVDTSNIFIGGHSAGAFIALHNVYMDRESERPAITFDTIYNGDQLHDQGCLDCIGGNTTYDGQAKSIFSLAGGVGSTSYLESAEDPDVVMFHSEDDDTVPYNSGEPFMSISPLIFGSDLDTVYGSLPISLRADSLNIDYTLHSYTNRGHNVHRNGDTLYSDIIPGISDWFFDQHLKPDSVYIMGDSVLCPNDLIQNYSLELSSGLIPNWDVIGGTILLGDTNSESIIIEWDENVVEKYISLSVFNYIGAESEKAIRNIEIEESLINTWIVNSGQWEVDNNWSNGHKPLPCQEVVILENVVPIDLVVSGNEDIEIKKLTLGENVTVELESGVFFKVLSF